MISVIIPTLDAAPYLGRALAPLVAGAAEGLIKEVIVADGGSKDETLLIADGAGCTIVLSEAGRGKQLIAGAKAARGAWLLFLHADTELSGDWLGVTARFLKARDAAERVGVFRFAFDDASAGARTVMFWARLRSKALKLPYGDQGLLISRELYDALGGFKPLALMEDVEFVRRIGGARIVHLEADAMTSADKYRRDGFSRRAWRNLGLLLRYFLGADPAALARAYD